MTASVSNLFICPRCSEAMSHATRPDTCPKCKYRFGNPDEGLATKFEWHKSPERQLFELIQQDMDKFKDKPLEEIAKSYKIELPEKVKEDLKESNISNEARHNFIKNYRTNQSKKFYTSTRPEDVQDLFVSMRTLMSLAVSSGNKDLALKLVAWGKELGRISEAIENYVRAGGEFFDKK